MTTLKSVRAAIASVQTDLVKHVNALSPLESRFAEIEPFLNGVAKPFNDLLDRLVDVLTITDDTNVSLFDLGVSHERASVDSFALAAALTAHDRAALVKKIENRVTALDTAYRLPPAERDAKIFELRSKLFDLELQEEGLLDGASRRDNCNPAAVLGIPLEVAQKYSFFSEV